MNKRWTKAVFAGALAVVTQVSAGFIDVTGGYNVLTFGDFSSFNDQTWGSLAASGDVNVDKGYSIGTQWAHSGSYPTNVLVAGGNVDLTGNGSVWGGISAGGTVNSTLTVHGATNAGADIGTIFDFDDAKSKLEFISKNIAEEEAIAANLNGSGLFFTGVEGVDVNYFTVDAKDFQNITYMEFKNITNGSKAVITVTGTDVSFVPQYGGNFGMNGISKEYGSNILWNFADAKKLTVGGSIGTIVALGAEVNMVGGEIWGDLITGSVSGRSEIHVAHYNGDFDLPPDTPEDVPEGSTVTMLIAGALAIFFSRKNAFVKK